MIRVDRSFRVEAGFDDFSGFLPHTAATGLFTLLKEAESARLQRNRYAGFWWSWFLRHAAIVAHQNTERKNNLQQSAQTVQK
jgi:hypothetical protein